MIIYEEKGFWIFKYEQLKAVSCLLITSLSYLHEPSGATHSAQYWLQPRNSRLEVFGKMFERVSFENSIQISELRMNLDNECNVYVYFIIIKWRSLKAFTCNYVQGRSKGGHLYKFYKMKR